MKLIKNIAFLLIVLLASSPDFAWSSSNVKLKSGDVLLVSLNCYMCSLIEKTTGEPYSHSGIVLEKGGKFYIAQALGSVHLTTISEFLNLKKFGTKVLVLRPRSVTFKNSVLWQAFRSFEGLPFDSKYLWDDESLYCSELVAKFFQRFYPDVLAPKLIDYGSDAALWERVLGGNTNEGEWGNSPASLMHDSFFKVIGTL